MHSPRCSLPAHVPISPVTLSPYQSKRSLVLDDGLSLSSEPNRRLTFLSSLAGRSSQRRHRRRGRGLLISRRQNPHDDCDDVDYDDDEFCSSWSTAWSSCHSSNGPSSIMSNGQQNDNHNSSLLDTASTSPSKAVASEPSSSSSSLLSLSRLRPLKTSNPNSNNKNKPKDATNSTKSTSSKKQEQRKNNNNNNNNKTRRIIPSEKPKQTKQKTKKQSQTKDSETVGLDDSSSSTMRSSSSSCLSRNGQRVVSFDPQVTVIPTATNDQDDDSTKTTTSTTTESVLWYSTAECNTMKHFYSVQAYEKVRKLVWMEYGQGAALLDPSSYPSVLLQVYQCAVQGRENSKQKTGSTNNIKTTSDDKNDEEAHPTKETDNCQDEEEEEEAIVELDPRLLDEFRMHLQSTVPRTGLVQRLVLSLAAVSTQATSSSSNETNHHHKVLKKHAQWKALWRVVHSDVTPARYPHLTVDELWQLRRRKCQAISAPSRRLAQFVGQASSSAQVVVAAAAASY